MFQSSESMGIVADHLRTHCVKGLRAEHQDVIAARIHAGDCDRGSRLLSYSRSQTQRRWNEVKDFVLVPLGLTRHDDALAGLWLGFHSTCCVVLAFSLLETDSRFASEIA